MELKTGLLAIKKFRNKFEEMTISLHRDVPWVKDILDELSGEHCGHKEPLFVSEITLVRKTHLLQQEVYLCQGNLSLSYEAQCVRCLEIFSSQIQLELAAAFVSKVKEEEVSIYIDEKEYDLYPMVKGHSIDLKEFFHEQIFLNFDPRPLHDYHCQGLCQVCGSNLNHHICSHEQQIVTH